MRASPSPEDGDVIVEQKQREGTCVFAVRVVPGAGQFLLPTREEAVALARAFAKRQRVQLWFANGDGHVELLG